MTGNPNFNAYEANPHIDNSDHYMVRVDEQLGSKDMLFFRYDEMNVTDISPNSLSQHSADSVSAKNLGAVWRRAITPNFLFDFRFGIATRPFHRGSSVDAGGLGPLQAAGFTSVGGTLLALGAPYANPAIASGFGSQAQNTISNPVVSYTPTMTWFRSTAPALRTALSQMSMWNVSSEMPPRDRGYGS